MADRAEMRELEQLRKEIGDLNFQILELLSRRGRLVQEVKRWKECRGTDLYSPRREAEMLDALVAANPGPFRDAVVKHLFREIFRASLRLMEEPEPDALLVSRRPGESDHVVAIGDLVIGQEPLVIAGPCSVEGAEQMEVVGKALARLGVRCLRGGAFKPRTSPYAFQGLGEEGLHFLQKTARRHGMVSVSEVVDTRTVGLVARYVDILQVGSRNMSNFELLKAVARAGRPVLLKRGFAATLEEFLQAAEYIALAGNPDILLVERGIRTFDRNTRFTLDISAVPLLRRMSRLPVLVDVSHAAGRRDILPDLARAALAAGAKGVMVEVHPQPHLARSDSEQQLDLEQFEALMEEIRPLLAPRDPDAQTLARTSAAARRAHPGSPNRVSQSTARTP